METSMILNWTNTTANTTGNGIFPLITMNIDSPVLSKITGEFAALVTHCFTTVNINDTDFSNIVSVDVYEMVNNPVMKAVDAFRAHGAKFSINIAYYRRDGHRVVFVAYSDLELLNIDIVPNEHRFVIYRLSFGVSDPNTKFNKTNSIDISAIVALDIMAKSAINWSNMTVTNHANIKSPYFDPISVYNVKTLPYRTITINTKDDTDPATWNEFKSIVESTAISIDTTDSLKSNFVESTLSILLPNENSIVDKANEIMANGINIDISYFVDDQLLMSIESMRITDIETYDVDGSLACNIKMGYAPITKIGLNTTTLRSASAIITSPQMPINRP